MNFENWKYAIGKKKVEFQHYCDFFSLLYLIWCKKIAIVYFHYSMHSLRTSVNRRDSVNQLWHSGGLNCNCAGYNVVSGNCHGPSYVTLKQTTLHWLDEKKPKNSPGFSCGDGVISNIALMIIESRERDCENKRDEIMWRKRCSHRYTS